MGTKAVAVREAPGDARQEAFIKALGLDKVTPEQRELALAIADRYDLDVMLKHLVMIDGRPYISRDGLLWVAHRSGQFDGIEVTDPVLENGFWRSRCRVFRKDISRPIEYPGRYPASGGNARFAPEMAIKVAEVMALRRAFNVSAPAYEERWERDDIATAAPTEAPKPIAQRIAERAAVTTRQPDTTPADASPEPTAEPSGEDDTVEGAAVEVAGLSADDLRSWLREHFVGITEARDTAKRLFGNDSLTAITDEQRVALRDELAAVQR